MPSLPTYEASSHGRIRHILYEQAMPRGGVRIYGGKEWLGVWEPNAQRYQVAYKGKTYKVARMVCEAFHGEPAPSANVCMHLDENPKNNRPENLSWGTQRENLNAPLVKRYHAASCRRKMAGQPVVDLDRSYEKRRKEAP